MYTSTNHQVWKTKFSENFGRKKAWAKTLLYRGVIFWLWNFCFHPFLMKTISHKFQLLKERNFIMVLMTLKNRYCKCPEQTYIHSKLIMNISINVTKCFFLWKYWRISYFCQSCNEVVIGCFSLGNYFFYWFDIVYCF